jgi:hypothetical protein
MVSMSWCCHSQNGRAAGSAGRWGEESLYTSLVLRLVNMHPNRKSMPLDNCTITSSFVTDPLGIFHVAHFLARDVHVDYIAASISNLNYWPEICLRDVRRRLV